MRIIFRAYAFFFFSSRRRHTRWNCDWSSDVCSSDLEGRIVLPGGMRRRERREDDLLAITWEQVEPALERAHQHFQRQMPLVQHGAAHVHRLDGLLGVEEGRVEERE